MEHSPEPLQVHNHKRAIDWLASRTRGSGQDLPRERLRVDQERLPESLRRDVLVELYRVDATEMVYVYWASPLVGLAGGPQS